MAGLKDLKNSKYLTKEDCEPAIQVTIAGWKLEDVSRDNEPADEKYILSFHETPKPLVLNNVNGESIAQIVGSGDDFDKWIGTVIVLFNDKTVKFGDKRTGGIRVYIKQDEVVGVNPAHKETIGNAMNQHNNQQQPPPPFDPDIANAPNNGGNPVSDVPF